MAFARDFRSLSDVAAPSVAAVRNRAGRLCVVHRDVADVAQAAPDWGDLGGIPDGLWAGAFYRRIRAGTGRLPGFACNELVDGPMAIAANDHRWNCAARVVV